MSNSYRDKLLTIGVISQRTRTSVREGREHPETGVPWKSTTEPGSGLTTTEHATRDDRVDALVVPATVHTAVPASNLGSGR